MSKKNRQAINKTNRNKSCAKTPLEKLREREKTPEYILLGMNPELRAKYEEIKQWFEREHRHDLLSRYKLGLTIKEIYDDETGNGSERYGEHAVDRIAKPCRGMMDWCTPPSDSSDFTPGRKSSASPGYG
jgi:hypothetical protein